ncbi:hypothetical protein D3C76_1313130 [compost metagenome]
MPQTQVVAQLMCQGHRLAKLGGVARAGRAVSFAGRCVQCPHAGGRAAARTGASPRWILVGAEYIEVGENLFPIRDPTLIEGGLPLSAIRLVGLAIAILVPLVHQHPVVHPLQAEVVGGVAAGYLVLDQSTVIPQVSLGLAGEGDVAVGEAQLLGHSDYQANEIHQLAAGADLQVGLPLGEAGEHQPILTLRR